MTMNKKHIINERRHKVAELYLQGWPQFKIAKEVGVTQPQVSYDLKHLSKKWQENAMINIDKIKARELAKLDQLEWEFYRGWIKSKELQVKEKKRYKDARLEEVSKETIDTSGDPRFLDGILKCLSKREELLGYGAPSKKAIDVDLNMEGMVDELPEVAIDLILERIFLLQKQSNEQTRENRIDKGPDEG